MIVFRSLNLDDIKQIVELELKKVAQRLEEHEVALVSTPASLEELAKRGFDPDMGARPLRRIIQQKVEDTLSDAMLAGEYEDGDTIMVDLNDDDEIILRRATEEEASPPAEPIAAN